MSGPDNTRDDGRGGNTPASGLPATPPGFTGVRRTTDDGHTAELVYVRGEVVEIRLLDADGVVRQRVYADDGAMRTVHAQSRFVWNASDIEVQPPPGKGDTKEEDAS